MYYSFKYICICKNTCIYVYINMDSQIKKFESLNSLKVCVHLCAYKNTYSIYMYVYICTRISLQIYVHIWIYLQTLRFFFFSILIQTLYYSMLLNYLIPVSSFQTENTFNIYRLAIIPLSIATHYSFLSFNVAKQCGSQNIHRSIKKSVFSPQNHPICIPSKG